MRVPSSDELVEKLKGDKEFLAAVRGDLAKKVEELEAVSYTHLDVYKRQTLYEANLHF